MEAKTRKPSARWTFEAAQDANSMHGLDVEAEIMQALAQEITAEPIQEVQHLRTLAGAATDTYDVSERNRTSYPVTAHAALAVLIQQSSKNQHGKNTPMAQVTMLLSTPTMLTVHSATTLMNARTTEGPFEAPTNTKFVGTLNNTMRVFVDQYAADNATFQ